MANIAGGGAKPLQASYEDVARFEGRGRLHPTQFMLDLIPEGTKGETSAEYSLQKYMTREPGYDSSFAISWLGVINLDPVTKPSELLEVFTKIHKVAMHHIKPLDDSASVEHSYCVGMGPNSDFEGIMDLVKQILFHEKKVLLSFYTEEKSSSPYIDYGVMHGDFFQLNKRTGVHTKLFTTPMLPNKRVEVISKIIKPIYSVGTIGDGNFPVRIRSLYRDKSSMTKKAIELMTGYLKSTEEIQTKQEIIEKICLLCRELEQLHYFPDGNGRTVFILANTLLSWNGLKPFYPTNTCIFDANSLVRMVKEVSEGQKRFTKMFGTKDQFNENLTTYKQKVTNLNSLITNKFLKIESIVKAFQERDFNLLLRLSSISVKYLELLQFLLENQRYLPIDIHSAGASSGSAMDIARTRGNAKAIEFLTPYQPKPDAS